MNKILITLIAIMTVYTTEAQRPKPNYDESKVPSFTLPDLLKKADGTVVKTSREWEEGQRAELYALFRDQMFGRVPDGQADVRFEVRNEDKKALGGKAIRREVHVYFSDDDAGPGMDILIYLPRSKDPVPTVVGLNFYGNHTIWDDPDISMTESWVRNSEDFGITENKATEASRGMRKNRWAVDRIIERGYGVATIYYGDIDPDYDDGFQNGVHPLFYKEGQDKPTPEEWGSIAAWAWGLSRAMDYFETTKDIDSKRVAVFGHSRLGKASLWAGASDERFAAIISNDSGCGGAALSKRKFGETVGVINTSFPHWFNDNFLKYNNNEEALPFDQHMLIALMAPRPVYIASAEEDQWADPHGEFLSGKFASPVYQLYGHQGMEIEEMPGIHQPSMGRIGYHIRAGIHDVTTYDWERYMDFMDKHMGRRP